MRLIFIAFAIAAAASAQPAFEVATVKPHIPNAPGTTGRTGIEEDPAQIRIENLSLRTLISIAFDLKGSGQLAGPGWLSDATFDITAKPPAGYKHEQLASLLRNLLTDRFKLAVHHETRPITAFALVVAGSGFKLHESANPRTYHTGRPGLIEGNQWSIAELADVLTRFLGAPVANQTGLAGRYDLKLEWTPDATEAAAPPEAGPSLFTALQEQFGLRLESKKIPADVVIVDHIERTPTAN